MASEFDSFNIFSIMCAIAGVMSSGPNHQASVSAISKMLETQRHRGPDGMGIFVGEGITLGHRRLAILDLSGAGRQPMTSRDGRWTIVFNGEIFNYRELRAQLQGPFRTSTDTEILLEAAAQWGVQRALEASIGMFAFGIWDAWKRELILARDRYGEKPLVYARSGTAFAFASELKALSDFNERRIHPDGIDAYLALGYVPAPLAIFRNCGKLPAGYMLNVSPGRPPQVKRWWHDETYLHGDQPHGQVSTFPFFTTALRQVVSSAVDLRLRSDLPVAVSLSGGVDSSIVAVECTRQGRNVEAFTVDFGRIRAESEVSAPNDTSDLAHAQRVARHLGLKHTILPVRGSEIVQDFDRLMWHYDEPFADSSLVPTFALARSIGSLFKVVLNGDGGDEAFGGYRHYEFIQIKQRLKAAAAAAGLCDGRGTGSAGVYVESKALFGRNSRRRLLRDSLPQGSSFSEFLAECYSAPTNCGSLKTALWLDRYLHLANGLNYKTDIAYGAFGAESRGPFLDHRVMNVADALSPNLLVRGRQKKIALRNAYRNYLPDGLVDRPKMGFGVPVKEWLAGPLHETVRELLPCPLLDSKEQTVVEGQQLWTLMIFAAWAKKWNATW